MYAVPKKKKQEKNREGEMERNQREDISLAGREITPRYRVKYCIIDDPESSEDTRREYASAG